MYILPIVLPIELPIELPICPGRAKGPGPDRLGFGLGGQGSWAGPAWFWLGGPRVLGRAGLVLAWGGTWVVGWGERGNFMYLYHNFSFVN